MSNEIHIHIHIHADAADPAELERLIASAIKQALEAQKPQPVEMPVEQPHQVTPYVAPYVPPVLDSTWRHLPETWGKCGTISETTSGDKYIVWHTGTTAGYTEKLT